MYKYICLLVIAFALTLNINAQSNTTKKINADKTQSSVTYAMSHPLHDWTAISKNVNAIIIYDETKKAITKTGISIPVSSFDSQNSNRDSHAIEVLDGIKIPNVTFSSTSIKNQNNVLIVNGNLTFHGITKPITFNATQVITDKAITISGNFEVKMSDYKIENPSLMGISTNDVIKLSFKTIFAF